MAFPVYSTAYYTSPCKRINVVMGRTKVDPKIDHAGVFNCRKISGSLNWSQHAFGNATDLFPTAGNTQSKLRDIANGVVYQATHRTKANRMRKLDVAEVIDHDGRRMWTPDDGWRSYSGSTGAHIHVTAKPKRFGTPACA